MSVEFIKHRSGCAAWTVGHPQRWVEGDEAMCDCGASYLGVVLPDSIGVRSALEQLIATWRERDKQQEFDYYGTDAWGRCADELEALLLKGRP